MTPEQEDALIADTIGKLKTLWNDDRECIRLAIRAAVAAERERCALICDSVNNYDNPMTANDCADAIRRG